MPNVFAQLYRMTIQTMGSWWKYMLSSPQNEFYSCKTIWLYSNWWEFISNF